MKKTIYDYFYSFFRRPYEWSLKKLHFAKKYEFINRSKGRENLLLIIAGFQPVYWDVVFERVLRNQRLFAEEIDVCVCVPGEDGTILRQKCEKNGWSYLGLFQDMLSQVQNTAIRLHPKAKWIFKLDEDMIISDYYFDNLKETYKNAERLENKEIGFVTPLINLNAACFEIVLSSLNALEEYESLFGKLRIGLYEKIHLSPEVASWIWSKSIPFDTVASNLYHQNYPQYDPACIRFSVGAVLFSRDFWENIGFLDVNGLCAMGVEETQMNSYCFNKMKLIIISKYTFVGHLGFFSQKEICKEFFERNNKYIKIAENIRQDEREKGNLI